MKTSELTIRPAGWVEAFKRKVTAAGILQREIAEAAEMDETQLSRYFSGRVHDPHLSMVIRLEQAYAKCLRKIRGRPTLTALTS